MTELKITGVDISLNNIGICKATYDKLSGLKVSNVLLIQPDKADEATKKQVRKNSDDLRRARFMYTGLVDAVRDSDIITIEMPVGSQSARAMASYGICIGVIAGISGSIIEVTPSEVKLAGAGVKTATKHEMIDWAVAKHPEANWKTKKLKGVTSLTNDNEHMADALASIYAGMKTAEFKAILTMLDRIKSAA